MLKDCENRGQKSIITGLSDAHILKGRILVCKGFVYLFIYRANPFRKIGPNNEGESLVDCLEPGSYILDPHRPHSPFLPQLCRWAQHCRDLSWFLPSSIPREWTRSTHRVADNSHYNQIWWRVSSSCQRLQIVVRTSSERSPPKT